MQLRKLLKNLIVDKFTQVLNTNARQANQPFRGEYDLVINDTVLKVPLLLNVELYVVLRNHWWRRLKGIVCLCFLELLGFLGGFRGSFVLGLSYCRSRCGRHDRLRDWSLLLLLGDSSRECFLVSLGFRCIFYHLGGACGHLGVFFVTLLVLWRVKVLNRGWLALLLGSLKRRRRPCLSRHHLAGGRYGNSVCLFFVLLLLFAFSFFGL